MQLILDYIGGIIFTHKCTVINAGLRGGDNLNHNLFITTKPKRVFKNCHRKRSNR